ncbi:MAG TPA: SDR family NAD(P)-dependent oxidoreductase, partial [Actinomycetota bacterium]|nr:SDR family NAD(P)-dependent oxidoreductase [Actinomycetota bacterium]
RGHRVWATARRLESIADLESHGCKLLRLDVTDRASMEAAVSAIETSDGVVDVLVNNAGYGLQGAAETTNIDDVRAQFETNLFGPVALTQLVLPKMRRQRWGRIVNISSMGGKITLPGGAYYHATKHALEAFSDVLRFEVRPFGVDVIVIEPGLIKTRFGDAATETLADTEGPYAEFDRAVGRTVEGAYSGPMALAAVGPEPVAKTIATAIESTHPRTRYVVPARTRGILWLRRLATDRMWDRAMRVQYPPPKP